MRLLHLPDSWITRCTVVSLVLLSANGASAQVNKCVIAGQIVYQDGDCPAGSARPISTENLSVVPPHPVRKPPPVRTVTPRGSGDSIKPPSAPPHHEQISCNAWARRIKVIDALARKRSTQRLADERRELMDLLWKHECKTL